MNKSRKILSLLENEVEYGDTYKQGQYVVAVDGYHDILNTLNLTIARKDGVVLRLNLDRVKDPEQEIKKLLPTLDKYFPKGTPQEIPDLKNITKPLIFSFGKKNVGLVKTEYSPWGKAYKKQWGVGVYFPWIKTGSYWVMPDSKDQIPNIDCYYLFKDNKAGKEFIRNFGGYTYKLEI